MRRIIHSDIVAAARVLLCVPTEQRDQMITTLFEIAHLGDKLRRRLGRKNLLFGDGTLRGAACLFEMKPQRNMSDIEFGQCFLMVLAKMQDKMRAHQARKLHKNL
ncbi:hypothetical protein BFP76_07315 [Amylibacter kogurei]|uniref:DUF7742 domain-containing protein n=1 Tax=Paramylibacter kogurei TaxID=1889778 RepID=A0A2G5K8D6_9RHOB|nr:hypothetical protein [Amylibacter kogurei]PIB24954.1 hypothetical protein BFP76_07315 [Amylibacter kogurei]